MPSSTRFVLVRDAVSRLADAGLAPAELLHEVRQRISRAIPFEQAALVMVDPDTFAFNSRIGLPDAAFEHRLIRHELLADDVHNFPELARQSRPAAALNAADARDADRSQRIGELLRPQGLGGELRAAFCANGTAWGVACFVRASDSRPFDAEEERLLGELAPEVGRGLSHALLRAPEKEPSSTVPREPGAFIVDRELRIHAATGAAARWDRLMPGDLRTAVMSVAIRVLDDTDTTARVRVRVPGADWLLVHASPLQGGAPGEAGHVGVVVEPAPRGDVASLMMRLHGLTAREREVAGLLLRPLSIDDVATRLTISRHTLRDHVKAIFRKAGVTSRHELIARYAGEAAPEPAARRPDPVAPGA